VTRRSSNLLSEADGTIRMLAVLTALYQERYLSPLIIEEPEKALYPDALAVCSDVLQEAAFSYQVLITTLSPDLITELPLDSLRVVEKENDLTKIGPISNHQYEAIEDQLFSAGALMRIEGLEPETGEHPGGIPVKLRNVTAIQDHPSPPQPPSPSVRGGSKS